METCRDCGDNLTSNICDRCGHPVHPTEVPPDKPARRWRGAIAASIGAGLVAIALIGILVPKLAASTPIVNSGSATAPTSTASAIQLTAQCWDGGSEPRIENCSTPTGRPGLDYIFPEHDSAGDCVAKNHRDGRKLTYQCNLGDKSLLRFSWWRVAKEGRAHYKAKYAKGACRELAAAGKAIGRICRDRARVDGRYRMSGSFEDHFSFTVEARTMKEQDALLSQIAIRNPVNFHGHLVSTGPAPNVGFD